MIELDMSDVGIKNYEISVKVDDNEWQNIDNEEEEVKDIIKLLSKKDEHSEVKSKCEIECSGEAEKIAIFFNLLARWGNCGHSYDYVIDDDNNFGYDGDGSDRIHSVKLNNTIFYPAKTKKEIGKLTELLNSSFVTNNTDEEM